MLGTFPTRFIAANKSPVRLYPCCLPSSSWAAEKSARTIGYWMPKCPAEVPSAAAAHFDGTPLCWTSSTCSKACPSIGTGPRVLKPQPSCLKCTPRDLLRYPKQRERERERTKRAGRENTGTQRRSFAHYIHTRCKSASGVGAGNVAAFSLRDTIRLTHKQHTRLIALRPPFSSRYHSLSQIPVPAKCI